MLGKSLIVGNVAVLCAVGALAVSHGETVPAPAQVAAAPAEDAAGFNCWTMGNLSCGDAFTVPGEGSSRGAVLPVASGTGRATVAWSSGAVWDDAPRWWRYVSWRQCVTGAEGTDASMRACDARWQYQGERFDMSEAHCYAEAWINDDPDAAMLARCED